MGCLALLSKKRSMKNSEQIIQVAVIYDIETPTTCFILTESTGGNLKVKQKFVILAFTPTCSWPASHSAARQNRL